ncbi:armadillo repeat-containing protein 4 [Nephila pilipes]|uniref:Armadillo repeat-containing protein 4 n=1 Tax=Nephila pilipes TaxID=299642 RepID=A0A8X6MZE2_NEPPI|nr:armadillo repeat-containing protein 4 [Nephila pilipes]
MVIQASPSSYKSISTLLTYIQGGNITTTTLALICLNEALTYDAPCLQALIDGKAVKLLLNILEAGFLCVRRSQFAALRCLSKLCGCRVLQKDIMSPRGIFLLFNCLNTSDYELMLSAICMISDISSDPSCWKPSRDCGGVQKLVKAYIVGAIGSCLKNLVLRDMLKKSNGIEIMVSFLQTTFIPLIINLNDAMAKGSEDTEILIQYLQLDAVQLIWSCLKNADFQVQSSAATALCIILKNMKNANLQIENSLDGIECIIDLLVSKRKELLIPACTLIHNLAKDKNALSVLVEFNVASHLMRLMKTVFCEMIMRVMIYPPNDLDPVTDKKLLRQLCLAVASCCSYKKGCEKFADCGITPSLLKHLKAKNKPLRITAASALAMIASLPNWCSVVSQNRIIPVRTFYFYEI